MNNLTIGNKYFWNCIIAEMWNNTNKKCDGGGRLVSLLVWENWDNSKLMNVDNAKCRYPSLMLSVNETLFPYREAIGFKQYNPK